MATVNKDFKVKNGLIVEGSNGTINGHDILTKAQDDQNYIIGLIGGSATSEATANAVVLRDGNANFAANVITADLVGDVTGTVSDLSNHTTDSLTEGVNSLYFTDARAQAAVAGDISSAIDALDTDDIEEGVSNLYFTNQRAIDAVGGTIGDAIDALTTDDIEQGSSNLYFSNTLARGAVSDGDGLNYNSSTGEFSAHLGNGLEIGLNGEIQIDDSIVATDSDVSGAISSHNASSGVHGVTGDVVGTSDAQTLSNKILGNSISLGATIDAQGYTITDLAEPQQATDAATKAYVDGIAEGLHIHASAVAATTGNINLATDLENGDVLDGVTLVTGDRVLVKNQSTAAQNGIYVVQASGAAVRAADFDAPAEVDGGDFIFVTGGTVNADTGWVQTSELVATIGTDPIYFTQFSGAGTFLAGYGLYLNGNEFNVDGNVIASNEYVANAVSDHADDISGIHGVSGNVVGTSDSQTLTNKTLGASTVLGADLDAANSYTVKNLEEPTNNQDAATKFYVDSAISGVEGTISALDTDDVAEGSNLYFTNARAKASAAELLTGATLTNITITGDGSGLVITAENGVDDSTTDDLDEGSTNLYFSNARAQAAMVNAITGGTQDNISVTYDALSGTYTFSAENGVADSDTDDLVEGSSNLYFTNARAIAALEAVTPNFVELDINSVATQVAATTGNVETASQVTAYAWPKANYRSAEFLVKVAYGTHTEVSKVLLTMDTSDNIAITEYAIVGTNGSASTITADVSGTDARLRVTTLNNNSTVTIAGTLLV